MRNARRLLRVVILAAVIAGFVVPSTEATAALAKPSLATLQQQIKDQSTALEKIVEQYDQVSTLLAKNQVTEQKLRAQIPKTQSSLNDAQGHLAAIASVAYMGGTVSPLTALVTAADTTDLLNQLATMNQIAAEQSKQIVGFQQVQGQYQAQEQTLRNLIGTETAQRTDLATQKATITAKLAVLYKERSEAFGSPTVKASPTSRTVKAPSDPGRGGQVVRYAYAQLGKPYAWAKDGPNSFDCSGLVLAAYRSVGVSLPHNARMQWGVVRHISRASLEPGDLVFYESLGHVAIYIGGGQVIHAPTFGERVKISSINMMSPYGFGRV